MVLWSIWKQRNDKHWEDKMVIYNQVVDCIKEKLCEWIWARRDRKQPVNRVNPSHAGLCQPPPNEWLKCNVDAAFKSSLNKTGMGICLRGETGLFVVAKTELIGPTLRVHEGETLLHAMWWFQSLGISHAIFEMDNKTVVDSLTTQQASFLEFGIILYICRSILESTQNIQVKFIRRQANIVTHYLTGTSMCYASPQVFNSPPTCIVQHLINEMH